MAMRIQTCGDNRIHLCRKNGVLAIQLCETAPCECPADLDSAYDVTVCGETFTMNETDDCFWSTGIFDPAEENDCKAEDIVEVVMTLVTSEPCRWRVVVGFDDFSNCTYEKETGGTPVGTYQLVSGTCTGTANVTEAAP